MDPRDLHSVTTRRSSGLVLIYGARPVRYQVEFVNDGNSRRSRSLWDYCLGPSSLVTDKSGVRQNKTQLFYEVTYPEAFLKKLGE